jgi:hypothetical protein
MCCLQTTNGTEHSAANGGHLVTYFWRGKTQNNGIAFCPHIWEPSSLIWDQYRLEISVLDISVMQFYWFVFIYHHHKLHGLGLLAFSGSVSSKSGWFFHLLLDGLEFLFQWDNTSFFHPIKWCSQFTQCSLIFISRQNCRSSLMSLFLLTVCRATALSNPISCLVRVNLLIRIEAQATHYMERNPSWEAYSRLVSPQIPLIFWKLNLLRYVHKRPPLEPVLCQIIQSKSSHTYFKIHFNIILPPVITSLKHFIPFIFPDAACISHHCRAYCIPRPFHPPWFCHSNNFWWRVQIM